jgi:putative ABC transport system permease protein
MLAHYFKTTFRHIGRNKINFGFKLGGLTLALFSLLIIVLYVSYQLSFDKFHDEYENIYRVNSNRDEGGKVVPYSMVPPAIGPALKEALPEVTAYTRMGVSSRVMIQYQEKLFRLTGFVEADSSIFNVLSFKFLRGNKTALHQPGSIVLTQSLARQIFGDEDPMDKVITSPDHANRMLNVRGIVEDFPLNSHLLINAIHSFGSLQNTDLNSWKISWDGSVNLYVRLTSDADPEAWRIKTTSLLRKNLAKSEDGSEKRFSLYLQPITDIYLDEMLKMEFNKKGNALYVYIFSLLGMFLLAIACINYVNLSIADFDTRRREIGVRKVLGAQKTQIGFQVALEAVLISTLALLISVVLLYVTFPVVNQMLDPNLRFEMLMTTNVMTLAGIVILLIVIFSAAYPSYRLALPAPAQELKPNATYGDNMSVGKMLLLVQYAISILCICATVVVSRQLSFVQETDLGYDRTHVVSLIMPDEYPSERVSVLKNELARLAGVEVVSYSYYLMPVSTYFKGWYQVERKGKLEKILLNEMFVDHDYFETMGIKVTSGRNFDKANASDARTAFVINETAAKELGWANPLGKRMKAGYADEMREMSEGTVIGVVKDFHTLSLHKKIEPVVLRLQYDAWPGNSLNIKVRGTLSKMLPAITAMYEKLMPGFLADARVLEDLYKRQYQHEHHALATLQVGTVIVILISALGIFSLSLYMSVKRMKEFGIRKVLGATVQQIISLHISYFIKIVLLANILALPLACWLMKAWLNDFAYRTELNSLIFLTVMCVSFLLVIISGGYAALRAGRMNPVDVLKIQ